MSRRVRSGMFDQRDRATKRRRDRPTAGPGTADPYRELRSLIESVDPDLDLDAYLRATGSVDLPRAERLRILAIERENSVPFEALRRIYERALDSDDPWIHASFGIAASEHATLTSSERTAMRLHALAHVQLTQAAHMAEWGDLKYLRMAANGDLPQLLARVDALTERLDSER